LNEVVTLSLNSKGGSRMSPFTGFTNPEQQAIMTEVFEDHRLQHNIVDEYARTDTAQLVMLLFDGGARTVEELKARLARLLAQFRTSNSRVRRTRKKL
jgi:hypothetical protein